MTTTDQPATTATTVPVAQITISAREAEVDLDRTSLEQATAAIAKGLGQNLGEVKLTRITCEQNPNIPASWSATVSLPVLDMSLTLAGLDALFGATAAAFHEAMGWRQVNVTLSWFANPAARRSYGSVSMCYSFKAEQPK